MAGAREVPQPAVLAAESARIDVIRAASAATIAIFAPGGRGGGSGVLISPDGYALTNFHVVQMGPALECGLPNGQVHDAVVVGIDPTGDVALIQLFGEGEDFPYVPLGDSATLQVGAWVLVLGNPFLLAEDFQPTVSHGIVSGLHRYQYPAGTLLEYTDCIQTDAAINPGNSGGPLVDMAGNLVGINGRGSFEKRGRVNVGVGYAISINQIKNFLGYLKSGRIVDHASLGATVTVDASGRVVVDAILETSDAYRRGLRYGDELVQFAGRDMGTINTFKNVLGTLPKGWRVPIAFRRDGVTYDRWVRLAGAHRAGELAELADRSVPEVPEGPEPDKKPPGPDRKIPNLPNRPPIRIGPQSNQLPAVVASHYRAERGFANYYYNLQNRNRIWDAMVRRADFKNATYGWSIAGTDRQGGRLAIELDRHQAVMERTPGGRFEIRFQDGTQLTDRLDPPGTGGLFALLHMWQRLLIEGPETFGELDYLGTMPMPGRAEWVDVLVGTYAGMETKFYFDATAGHLVGIETFVDPDRDPCEVYFDDYRAVAGRELPFDWRVRYGDQDYAQFEISNYVFHGAPDPEDARVARQSGPTAATAAAMAWQQVRAGLDLMAGSVANSSRCAVVYRSVLVGFQAALPAGGVASAASPGSFTDAVRSTQPKMVKIFGSGGIARLEGYQSGCLISGRGHVLTVWSYVLNDAIRVVLADGARYDAELIGADAGTELAVLKIDYDGDDLPHFELAKAVRLDVGARILAFSNLFRVATGNEPVSVQHGLVSAIAPVHPRLDPSQFRFHGDLYFLDAITNNPGAAGGVLTDHAGHFAGILGKELRDRQTRAWFNYALPATAFVDQVDAMCSGQFLDAGREDPLPVPDQPLTTAALGMVLVPDVVAQTPPYVDAVRPDSPADRAGVRPDDLVVYVENQLVTSCQALREVLARYESDARLRIVFVRGDELIERTLGPD